MSRTLTVIRPGLLTTIQDLGRWGQQRNGVPVGGPMDEYSHRAANSLVGNSEHAAALEITLLGPELRADAELRCALAGAEFEIRVGGVIVACGESFAVPADARLRIGARRAGSRATLAVAGGIAVPAVFGSRATTPVCGIGPLGGRALASGDVLPVGEPSPVPAASVLPPLALPAGGARLRVIPGPHEAMFAPAARELLFRARFKVTPQSDRMGYRLQGPALTHAGSADVLSDGTPMGSIQVPASGQPILLMADRQTTGGYPRIATVISADLPLAGQLAPGDWVEFAPCTLTDADAALKLHVEALAGGSA